MSKRKVNVEKGKKGFQPVANEPVEPKKEKRAQPTLHNSKQGEMVDGVKGLNVTDAYVKVNIVSSGSTKGGAGGNLKGMSEGEIVEGLREAIERESVKEAQRKGDL